MDQEHEFKVDDRVEKHGGAYGGPGIVRGVLHRPDNQATRYIVGHRIAGGYGEFWHIYSGRDLRADDGSSTKPAPSHEEVAKLYETVASLMVDLEAASAEIAALNAALAKSEKERGDLAEKRAAAIRALWPAYPASKE